MASGGIVLRRRLDSCCSWNKWFISVSENSWLWLFCRRSRAPRKWSFLIPHIDPDLGLYTICLDICARAQKCWSQCNPGATILTSWWLREIQTWVCRQFVLILVHEYKVWVTRQYRHSFFDTLIWFPIVHYHTCNVDVKPHVADYITGWNLLSHNCVFDT